MSIVIKLAQQILANDLLSWFGGSKVSNKGQPLLVYHGTDNQFTVFDRTKNAKSPSSKFGFWFTNDKVLAELHGSNLIKAYLKIIKPKVISGEQWNAIRDRHARDGSWFEQWRITLQKNGYDGLIVRGSSNAHLHAAQKGFIPLQDPDVFAVFSNNQIRIVP